MNNFSVLWSYTQFNSEQEAKKYCLSDECENNISSLDGVAYSLYEKGSTETPVSQGMGLPYESPSSMEASYVSNEADRLRTLRKYFKGESPKAGYKWVYSTHGLHSVSQHIDLSNVNEKHPVFLEYIKEQNISKKEKKEAYKIWLTCMTEGGVNNLFKMTYHFRMKNLIPDGLKMFDKIK